MRRLTIALLRLRLAIADMEIAIYNSVSMGIHQALPGLSQRRDHLATRLKSISPI